MRLRRRRPFHCFHLSILICIVHCISAVSIDNDIIGEPDIECMDDRIRVWVKTRKTFAGRIYAKGKADIEECYKDSFARESTKKPMFDLSFERGCGMRSLRSVDPRGMYYGVTIVVSFHPLFITKVDQAFHVKCFFEEANRGLTAELGVSMIPTTEVEARHGIPGCSYSIHKSSIQELDEGRPAGQAIQFARVGDKVLHQWACNDQMFGILINNCYVTDGFGKKAEVIDENGCPTNPILITGIRYSPDLQRAYAESQVFKFADKPGVWFFCQIQMCMKKAGMCRGVTPPACASVSSSRGSGPSEFPEPGGFTDDNFQTNGRHDYENGDYDISTQRVTRPRGKTRPAPEYPEDYENNAIGGGASAGGAYGYPPTTPNEFQFEAETTTLFGPPVPPINNLPLTVTRSFETDDDLQNTGTTGKSATKQDYNDYDDITIPPNLSELLANLPDDINADSLQKMFRDSVIDRRVLMEGMDLLKREIMGESKHALKGLRKTRSGERVDKLQVDWSTRRRDSPLQASLKKRDTTSVTYPKLNKPQRKLNSSKDAPHIAGQLLIYELDEEPPEEHKRTETCAPSQKILLWASAGLAGLSSTLLILLLFLSIKFLRLSRGQRHLTASRRCLTTQQRHNK